MAMPLPMSYQARPPHLFGGSGHVSFAVGCLGVGLHDLLAHSQAETVGSRPALLAGVLLVVVGMQLLLFGLLAELVVYSREPRQRVPLAGDTQPGRARRQTLMTAGAVSPLGAVAAAVWLILGLATVGVAVQLLWPKPTWPASGLAGIAGRGAAVAMVAVATSWVLLGDVRFGIVALATLVGAALAVTITRTRPRPMGARHFASGLDGWAFGLAVAAVLVPLVLDGWASWIPFPDLPSYVGSAYYWQDAGGYASAHMDYFGQGIIWRAEFEKPMVTGLFVFADTLRLPPRLAFPPLMITSIFVLMGTLAALMARVFHASRRVAVASVTVTTFAVVALSRVYEASIGHVVSAALCAVLISTFLACPPGWSGAIRGGVLLAAAFGSNFTLMLGFGPTLTVLILWLNGRLGVPMKDTLAQLLRTGLVAGLLLMPFAGLLQTSFQIQSTGAQGRDIPLATPLAVLGLQPHLDSPIPTWVDRGMWVGALAAGLWLRRRSGALPLSKTAILLLVTVLGSTAAIAVAFGPTNYTVLKIIAMQTWVVMPFTRRGRVSVAFSCPLCGSGTPSSCGRQHGIRDGLPLVLRRNYRSRRGLPIPGAGSIAVLEHRDWRRHR